MSTVLGLTRYRHNRLVSQLEAVFVQGSFNADYPFRVSMTPDQVGIATAVDVDTVAAFVFGRITGAVRGVHDRGHIFTGLIYRYDSDTDTYAKVLLRPHKAKIRYLSAQFVRYLLRLFQRTAFHENAELVSTKAGECVALTHVRLQHCGDLA